MHFAVRVSSYVLCVLFKSDGGVYGIVGSVSITCLYGAMALCVCCVCGAFIAGNISFIAFTIFTYRCASFLRIYTRTPLSYCVRLYPSYRMRMCMRLCGSAPHPSYVYVFLRVCALYAARLSLLYFCIVCLVCLVLYCYVYACVYMQMCVLAYTHKIAHIVCVLFLCLLVCYATIVILYSCITCSSFCLNSVLFLYA